jgi:hypothetical protein
MRHFITEVLRFLSVVVFVCLPSCGVASEFPPKACRGERRLNPGGVGFFAWRPIGGALLPGSINVQKSSKLLQPTFNQEKLWSQSRAHRATLHGNPISPAMMPRTSYYSFLSANGHTLESRKPITKEFRSNRNASPGSHDHIDLR